VVFFSKAFMVQPETKGETEENAKGREKSKSEKRKKKNQAG
jgi:hypothetical protein